MKTRTRVRVISGKRLSVSPRHERKRAEATGGLCRLTCCWHQISTTRCRALDGGRGSILSVWCGYGVVLTCL